MRAVYYVYLQEYRSPGHDDLVIRDCHDNDIYKLSGYKTLLRKYPYMHLYSALQVNISMASWNLTLEIAT